jgi:hypothetical protein
MGPLPGSENRDQGSGVRTTVEGLPKASAAEDEKHEEEQKGQRRCDADPGIVAASSTEVH